MAVFLVFFKSPALKSYPSHYVPEIIPVHIAIYDLYIDMFHYECYKLICPKSRHDLQIGRKPYGNLNPSKVWQRKLGSSWILYFFCMAFVVCFNSTSTSFGIEISIYEFLNESVDLYMKRCGRVWDESI